MNSVVVIEDDENIRWVLERVLTLEGHKVYTAGDGLEGLELLERIPAPSLILVDLTMPVMNGREFLERKRAHPRLAPIPTIVMSALATTMELPGEGFIAKPVELPKLLDTVGRVLAAKPPEFARTAAH